MLRSGSNNSDLVFCHFAESVPSALLRPPQPLFSPSLDPTTIHPHPAPRLPKTTAFAYVTGVSKRAIAAGLKEAGPHDGVLRPYQVRTRNSTNTRLCSHLRGPLFSETARPAAQFRLCSARIPLTARALPFFRALALNQRTAVSRPDEM